MCKILLSHYASWGPLVLLLTFDPIMSEWPLNFIGIGYVFADPRFDLLTTLTGIWQSTKTKKRYYCNLIKFNYQYFFSQKFRSLSQTKFYMYRPNKTKQNWLGGPTAPGHNSFHNIPTTKTKLQVLISFTGIIAILHEVIWLDIVYHLYQPLTDHHQHSSP